ncbi:thiazole biosynthesis protein [Buchnera aphidicola]|uniref:thiazole biosynthesis protein n=1 Tax=Buchnera aphidicola TaxID=9 RepID=UPI0031B70DD2
MKENKKFFYCPIYTAILDIRSYEEHIEKPINISNMKICWIPFYRLENEFKNLDQKITWLLYCEKGIMSKLQKIYLIKQGFKNVQLLI